MKKLHNFKGYNGIVWVGDPHLWSKRPGSRLPIEEFSTTVLNKISQSIEYAIANNYYLIFAGDLFDDANENDINLLTKLSRILKHAKQKLKNPVATVEGNHEKKQVKYTDDVATKLLQETDLLLTMEKNGLWGRFEIGKSILYIGSTPYGEKIPKEIDRPEDADTVMWLTHHNLAFGDNYPGIEPINEIKGVDILINGHIHKNRPTVRKGNMVAFNPGNITRLSIDCIDHIPQIWAWTPQEPQKLTPFTLTYNKNVFKNRESLIETEQHEPQMDQTPLTHQQVSRFVQDLQNFGASQDLKSDDGSIMKEKIEIFGKAKNASPELIEYMKQLVDKSITEDN